MNNKQARLDTISKLEAGLDGPVIAYIMADRLVFGTQVGQDAIRLFQQHLQGIGKVRRIGLVLYTRGGHTLTPLRLVRLIREYCDEFHVLIPYRAHSAGTLIALGADKIQMGRMGELAPIDPAVANPFNPEEESARPPQPGPKPKLAISVEDVTSYLALAAEKACLSTPETRCEAFMELARKVHPLALGNVHRSHTLIRLIAERLLSMHMDGSNDEKQIQHIVETLTEKLYAHDFMISRTDAKQYVGLNVEEPSAEMESNLWSLFELYEAALRLGQEIDIGQMLGSETDKSFRVESAIIESKEMTHTFVYEGRLRGIGKPPEVEVNVEIQAQVWRCERNQGTTDCHVSENVAEGLRDENPSAG